ncbi:siphovirus ReqiPepy6 Gp37-like family protein [Kurthia gibsonii]|uniref:siphovirus ReqiPepy6 Gp37-like family protein n=1 Tax=Kurthia gibsonii TaxID=33946 RepID=UPI00301794EF
MLRIIDKEFNLIDEISLYESLQITRKWHSIGMLELKINRYQHGANELIKDRIVFPTNQLQKGHVILHREIELDENGKETENWLIKALSLKTWLSQRIIMPPSHTSHDNKSGKAETVMKHYVNVSAVNPVDRKRIIPNLVIAPDLQRGDTISRSARFDTLSDELQTISELSGLGWNITIDIVNKKFVFDVSEGQDLTAYQRVNNPVIFSPKFNSLKSLEFTESYLDFKNTALVAGQGEGTARKIVMINDINTGYERHELYVDARDIADTNTDNEGNETPRPPAEVEKDLTDRGNEKLAELAAEIFISGQILTKSPFKYEEDWDIGDIVTLQHEDWGITLDTRITEVKESNEAGNAYEIEVVFDKDKPTLIDKIKREFKNLNPLVKA